jgi:hypothetical protein
MCEVYYSEECRKKPIEKYCLDKNRGSSIYQKSVFEKAYVKYK